MNSQKNVLDNGNYAFAEYVGMAEAAKELIYLRELFKGWDSGIHVGAQKLAMSEVLHCRTKHIDNWHHFLRDVVKNNSIDLQYCESHNIVADILTIFKSLPFVGHEKFVKQMGLNL